jgi:ligand-binding sensor domain-containing protein
MKTASWFKFVLLTSLLFLSFEVLYSQVNWNSEWKIFNKGYIYDTKYDSLKHLTSKYISSMLVDKNGYMWFATYGNIQLYNGKKIIYLPRKQYGGANFIHSLACDSKNNIWIGTDKGLFKYTDGVFQLVGTGTIKNVTNVAVNSKDEIWICGWDGDVRTSKPAGAGRFDGTSWTFFDMYNTTKLPDNYLDNITFDKSNNVWMSAGIKGEGIVKFDGTKWVNYAHDNAYIPSDIIRGIAVAGNGDVWVVGKDGMAYYDGKTWEKVSLKDYIYGINFGIFNQYFTEPELYSIAFDPKGVMWLGTANGVIRISGKSKIRISPENSPMTSNQIRKIYVDDFGRKWFLTGFFNENRSLYYFDPKNFEGDEYQGVMMYQDPVFNHYPNWKIYNPFTSDLNTAVGYEMIQDKDGVVWIASPSEGLIRYKDSTWNYTFSEKKGLIGDMLTSLSLSNNGIMYAGSELKGVFKLQDGNFQSINKDQLGYKTNKTVDVVPDNEGNIWIASIMGVDKCNEKSCEFFDKKNGLPTNNIFKIFKDSKGRIWICTTDGLAMYDKGNWTNYGKKNAGLPGYIYDVAEAKDGTLWAGGGKGIFKFDGTMWTEIKPTSNVPKFFTVYRMLFDNKDRLWIGTYNSGLICFDGQNWQYYNEKNSGIYLDRVNAILANKDGSVWFCLQKENADMPDFLMNKYEQEIISKIKKLNPTGSIVIFKE